MQRKDLKIFVQIKFHKLNINSDSKRLKSRLKSDELKHLIFQIK
jgi:hypothetical protein